MSKRRRVGKEDKTREKTREKTRDYKRQKTPIEVPPRAQATGSLTRTLAVDCEMVGVGSNGSVSHLARVSIVNTNGCVVYDSYVSPSQPVTDYRTRFSGIRPHHLRNAPRKEEVIKKVRGLVAGRILVGHAIHNDLEVLEIQHPASHTRDSSKFPRLMRQLTNGTLKPKKLSVLAEEELDLRIQQGTSGHCSIQDARASMALWKKHRGEWENWHRKMSQS